MSPQSTHGSGPSASRSFPAVAATFGEVCAAAEFAACAVMKKHGVNSPLSYLLLTGNGERSVWHELGAPNSGQEREGLIHELVPGLIREDAADKAVLCAPSAVRCVSESGSESVVDGVMMMGASRLGESVGRFVAGDPEVFASVEGTPSFSQLRYGPRPAAIREAVGFFDAWAPPAPGNSTAERPAVLAFRFALKEFVGATLTLKASGSEVLPMLLGEPSDEVSEEVIATCLIEELGGEAEVRAFLADYASEVELPLEQARTALRMHYATSEADAEVPPSSGGRRHRTGRNDPCPCGSQRKAKRCCHR